MTNFRTGTVDIVKRANSAKNMQTIGVYGDAEVRRLRNAYQVLAAEIADNYGAVAPCVRTDMDGSRWEVAGSSKQSKYADGTITLKGRFSMLTFLNRMARHLGKNDPKKWAEDLYAQAFTSEFGRLVRHGNALVDSNLVDDDYDDSDDCDDSDNDD